MPKKPFRFLDLPPEIREKIYILISTSPTPYILLNASTAHTTFPLNLLLTNAQIYHESRPLYFSTNAFSISLNRHIEDWDYFLLPSFCDNRRQIRVLRLNILRWGTKDFFAKKLLPVLEDCILNGRLRDLEVRMRYTWVLRPLGGNESILRGLKSLLRDPYLERGVLMAGEVWSDGVYGEPLGRFEWVYDNDAEGTWRKISDLDGKITV